MPSIIAPRFLKWLIGWRFLKLRINARAVTCRCSPELREIAGAVREPYREVLKPLEAGLKETIEMIMASEPK